MKIRENDIIHWLLQNHHVRKIQNHRIIYSLVLHVSKKLNLLLLDTCIKAFWGIKPESADELSIQNEISGYS